MDIEIQLPKTSQFDADKINNGVFLYLESIADDDGNTELLYLGNDKTKPMRALVRSYRSQVIKDAEQRLQRDGFTKVRKAPKKEKDKVISENSVLSDEQRFSLYLAALENVSTKEPGLIHLSPEQAIAIYRNPAYSDIVDQIKAFAYEDSHYLAGAATEAGNSSASTSSTPPKNTTSEA